MLDSLLQEVERILFRGPCVSDQPSRSAKEVRRSKAIQQKADLEKRRQQFGEGNVITFLLDTSRGGKPRDMYANEICKLMVHAGFKKDDVVGIKK